MGEPGPLVPGGTSLGPAGIDEPPAPAISCDWAPAPFGTEQENAGEPGLLVQGGTNLGSAGIDGPPAPAIGRDRAPAPFGTERENAGEPGPLVPQDCMLDGVDRSGGRSERRHQHRRTRRWYGRG